MDIGRAVATLATDHPEWVPVLEAALAVSDRLDAYGGEFAGAWVLEEMEQRAGHPVWVPNLRLLAAHGLLEKAGASTRGGRRAYYRLTAKSAIREALSKVPRRAGPDRQSDDGPTRFRFVGAGASQQTGGELARDSGDLRFEPRSWR